MATRKFRYSERIIKSYKYIDYNKIIAYANSNGIKNVEDAINLLLKNRDIFEMGNGYSVGGENYVTE